MKYKEQPWTLPRRTKNNPKWHPEPGSTKNNTMNNQEQAWSARSNPAHYPEEPRTIHIDTQNNQDQLRTIMKYQEQPWTLPRRTKNNP